MKRRLLWLVLMILLTFALTACQSPQASVLSTNTAAPSTRNNCYSLLHQLLNDQKDVSKLRFIKHEQDDVKKLVKRIATRSGNGAKLLEKFAKSDPSINLNESGLPPGELATRAAIASTKKKQLLGQTGDKFEVTLLLTQAEALNYGWHLAKVAAQNEAQPIPARALEDLSKDMENLYYEIFSLLVSRTK